MVKTRGATRKRKSPDPDFEYDLEEIERREEIEHVLMVEAAEEVEEAEAALLVKQRDEEKKTYGDFFHAVPPEVLTQILAFVDSPRDLLNLTVWSKACRNSITQKIIVRAAAFGDRRSHKTLTNVMDLVEQGSIRTPSTFRLLRLLNGTRCERLEDCFRFNLKENTSTDMSSDSSRPWGCCLCHSCVTGLGGRVPHYRDLSGIDSLNRVARVSGDRMLCVPHTEHASGEPVGPLFLAHKVQQIYTTYREPDDIKDGLDALVQKFDDELADKEFEKARREVLINFYHTARDDFVSWKESKEHMENEERQARSDERAARKRERCEAIMADIERLLEGYEHKDLILEGHWEAWSGTRKFTYGPSKTSLGWLTQAPSYASPSTLERKVREVRDTFDLAFANGFGTGNASTFLAFLANSEQLHEKALYDHREAFANEFSNQYVFFQMDGLFVSRLKQGEPLAALVGLLSWVHKKNAFVKCVVDDEANEQTREYFKVLARTVWGGGPSDPKTVEGYRTKYNDCRSDYQTLHSNMKAYLRVREVRKFLKLRGPPVNRPNQTFSRKDALRKFFELKHGSKEMLRTRQFTELFALHKRIFGDPWHFSYGNAVVRNY